ncbi:N(4)-acetylcytidine aminohydrolase [Shewanella surugensis]|uniref:N(4)-acetylcytidine amidohydrolase n=1 Tax=Shewanella surugensis TaxID=212020 RepID=A0ABT0L9G6_9GAMM|nr:N(4)-acetylcytidine aminohydrolase [Shewanella surugensis]MCL1124342.1 N(4)-acetylcytidine aminohydrolase [Shewanella surugensis]
MTKSMNNISFFERFEADILAKRKTITLRDESESHVKVGQILNVYTFESDREFCKIHVRGVTLVAFDALEQRHAEQENMTLAQLKALIQEIYPGISVLFLIEFSLVESR